MRNTESIQNDIWFPLIQVWILSHTGNSMETAHCASRHVSVETFPGADPASKFRGAISVIFGTQVSLWVHYCKRDKVNFTTLLWQNNGRQNGLIPRMIFSELYKIMTNKVILLGFRGGGAPSWIRPWTFVALQTMHKVLMQKLMRYLWFFQSRRSLWLFQVSFWITVASIAAMKRHVTSVCLESA